MTRQERIRAAAAGWSGDEPSGLHLWLLTDPRRPRHVGEINLVRSNQGVSLRYAPQWLQQGFPLSEDLPLIEQEFLPAQRYGAVGALDDARAQSWGERIIRLIDRPQRFSVLESLYLAGDERFGALGVSRSAERYVPRRRTSLPALEQIGRIHASIRSLCEDAVPDAEQAELVSCAAGLGGSSPKTLIALNGEPWIVKFSDDRREDQTLVEYATLTLARKAEIHAAKTLTVRFEDGHALAVKRFDREGAARRHCLSAEVALRAAGELRGYPELAQLLRRKGVGAGERYVADMRELFRRMVFNILIDNTDDHARNHTLIVTDRSQYTLSPAYDMLPAGRAMGLQQMRVGEAGEDSTVDNALSMSMLFALKRADAVREVRLIARVVGGWKAHFRAAGVPVTVIDRYASQIDRPFLLDQRREFGGERTYSVASVPHAPSV